MWKNVAIVKRTVCFKDFNLTLVKGAWYWLFLSHLFYFCKIPFFYNFLLFIELGFPLECLELGVPALMQPHLKKIMKSTSTSSAINQKRKIVKTDETHFDDYCKICLNL